MTTLYLLQFLHRIDKNIYFLKIGITDQKLNARYRADIDEFEITPLLKIKNITRVSAINSEKVILGLLKSDRINSPKLMASGGGSECFKCEMAPTLLEWLPSIAKALQDKGERPITWVACRNRALTKPNKIERRKRRELRGKRS